MPHILTGTGIWLSIAIILASIGQIKLEKRIKKLESKLSAIELEKQAEKK